MIQKISIGILVIALFSLVGCAQKDISPTKNFIQDERTQFEVGDKSSKKTLIYTHSDAVSQKTRKVIFYIDKLPYSQKFDLCAELKNETNKTIREGKKTYIYTSKPGTCPGFLNVVSDPNQENTILLSYKITLLEGYRLHNNHVKLPYRSKESTSNLGINIQSRATRFQESFWEYLED